MKVIFFGLAAIALYITVAVQTSEIARTSTSGYTLKSPTGILALLAVTAHGLVLYPATVTGAGINLGIFNVASLVAWIIALTVILATLRWPAHSLSVVILPFAAVILGVSLIFSHEHLLPASSPGIAIHIALSLLAYSLFAIAALQAIYLAFAEHRLKQHAPVLRFLPPLPTMVQLLFQLTGVAFLLLSAGLIIGGLYIEDVSAQHLAHKIFFSILAWLTFAVLLIGRYHWRWRGRRAVKYVIAGFAFLAVGFFGSKIALELILHRV
jgi:ABC-type uncharacterized transport system permease subunit